MSRASSGKGPPDHVLSARGCGACWDSITSSTTSSSVRVGRQSINASILLVSGICRCMSSKPDSYASSNGTRQISESVPCTVAASRARAWRDPVRDHHAVATRLPRANARVRWPSIALKQAAGSSGTEHAFLGARHRGGGEGREQCGECRFPRVPDRRDGAGAPAAGAARLHPFVSYRRRITTSQSTGDGSMNLSITATSRPGPQSMLASRRLSAA